MKKSVFWSGILLLSVLATTPGGGLLGQTTTKYLSISPGGFRPINWDQMAILMWSGTDDEFNFDTGAYGIFEALAPLNLPQGATIKKLTVYYTDNAPHANDFFVGVLNRRNMATGGSGALAAMTTESAPVSTERKKVEMLITKNNIVDNRKFSYSIRLFFHSGSTELKFNGAIIAYE